MKAIHRLMVIVLVLIGAGMVVLPSEATTIRTASHYGNGFGLSVSDCQNMNGNCEGFDMAPVNVNGTLYNGATFFYRTAPDIDGNVFADTLEIIDVGRVTSSTSFFLPLLNPSLLLSDGTLGTGLFSCGTDADGKSLGAAEDSQLIPMVGLPCTGGPDNPNNVTETILANGIQFTFTGSLSNFVVYTANGNVGTGQPVATPEPGSLALLGTGLVALLGNLRRRKQA